MAERAVTSRRLVWALTALLVAQVVHGLAPADEAGQEGSVGLVLGLLGLAATAVAIGMVVRQSPAGSRFAALVGTLVAAGFVAYHGLPFSTSVTNPYWGDGSATGAQWATVVLVFAAAAACVRIALAEPGTRRATAAATAS